MNNDNGEPDTYQTPSMAQELALAVLPIPSAILSILGSSVIIYMSISTRRQRKWTPYTRLLLCLSFYDIVASIALGMAAFLRDKDTSTRPFSFGSSGTCTMVGFFNQFSYGTLLYNGSLSLYFLLTARFGYSNAYIERVVEPWMHIIGNGFAVITSAVALYLGAYGEMTHGNGCWIADYPRGCGEGPECTSRLIGWLYFGLPAISIFILLGVFNSMILMFVRRHKVPSTFRISKPEASFCVNNHKQHPQEHTAEGGSSSFNEDDLCPAVDSSPKQEASNGNESQATGQSRDQVRRLRLVSTQAFLYVASFLMCNVWTGAAGIIESGGSTRQEELQLVVDHYGIFVMQAIFAPLQGAFNMIVFLRPKLHFCAAAFPGESRLWVIRRTIFGNRIKPTCASGRSFVVNGPLNAPTNADANDNNKETNKTKERQVPSSVTATDGDFDSSEILGSSSERWKDNTGLGSSLLASLPARLDSLRNRKSSLLEVISENEAVKFESSARYSIAEELVMDMSSGDFFPAMGETRWASDASSSNSNTPTTIVGGERPISMPRRQGSRIEEVEEPDESNSFRHLNNQGDHDNDATEHIPADQPIQVPRRRASGDVEVPVSPSCVHNTTDTETARADMPIRAPVRRESLDEDKLT